MIYSSIRRALPRFARDRAANVGMIFGFATIPVVMFTGFAVDYARGLNQQTRLQTAADATALALLKLPRTAKAGEITARGKDLFAAFYGAGGGSLTVDVAVNTDGVSVSGQTSLPTSVMAITGKGSMPISASSRAVYSKQKIEVALVLDNTGSMAQSGKMPALKAAVNDFINDLQAIPAAKGAIKMSVVPFNTQVKIGTSYAGSSALRWNVALENPALAGIGKPPSQAAWTGCISDRDRDYDVTSSPASGGATNYVASNCAFAPLAQMVPLTTDLEQARATANSMQPAGATNLDIGFATGLSTLRGDTIFGTQSATTGDVQKFLVLLTDGNNTMNRWGGNGAEGNSYVPQIDARIKLACQNARNGATAAVTVFTIRVIDGNAALLKDCASKPEYYFPAASAADIAPAFKAILNKIAGIRLTV